MHPSAKAIRTIGKRQFRNYRRNPRSRHTKHVWLRQRGNRKPYVETVYNQAVSETVCQGETYTLPDGTEVKGGRPAVCTTTRTSVSVGGCDSTIVTTLTVSPLPNLNLGNDIVVQNPR